MASPLFFVQDPLFRWVLWGSKESDGSLGLTVYDNHSDISTILRLQVTEWTRAWAGLGLFRPHLHVLLQLPGGEYLQACSNLPLGRGSFKWGRQEKISLPNNLDLEEISGFEGSLRIKTRNSLWNPPDSRSDFGPMGVRGINYKFNKVIRRLGVFDRMASAFHSPWNRSFSFAAQRDNTVFHYQYKDSGCELLESHKGSSLVSVHSSGLGLLIKTQIPGVYGVVGRPGSDRLLSSRETLSSLVTPSWTRLGGLLWATKFSVGCVGRRDLHDSPAWGYHGSAAPMYLWESFDGTVHVLDAEGKVHHFGRARRSP